MSKALLLLLLCAPAGAQQFGDLLFREGGVLETGGWVEPAAGGLSAVSSQWARGAVPVADIHNGTLTLTGRAERFESRASGVPSLLWRVHGGAAFSEELGERRRWGARATVGSASDDPFLTRREVEVQGMAHAMIPARRGDAWLFFLAYSNNRSFLNHSPMPGAGYMWNPRRELTVLAGIPFLSVSWRDPKWSARASLFGPTNVSAEADRAVAGPVRAFASFERSPLLWLESRRADGRERLIWDEKRLTAGLRARVDRGELSLEGGRAFDRRFKRARDAFRSGPETRYGPAWIVRLRASLRL